MRLLDVDAEMVTVELADGPARFHALWLRDNAQDEASRHGNDQRLFDVTDLAEAVTVVTAEVVAGCGVRTGRGDQFLGCGLAGDALLRPTWTPPSHRPVG